MNRGRRTAGPMGKLAGILGAAVAMAVVSAAPAAADTGSGSAPTIQVSTAAQLSARGAAVVVPVAAACSADSTFGSISVEVVQRSSGGTIARGYGHAPMPTCDGRSRSMQVVVTAQNLAFRTGPAYVIANFSTCSAETCVNAVDQGEVWLRRSR